jgi:hypothetical protein
MAKRQREDELQEAKKQPVPVDTGDRPLRHIDLLDIWTKRYVAEDGSIEKQEVEEFRRRLEWLDTLDDRFPMRELYEWEDLEEWIDREFETLGGDNWRCEHCTYAFAIVWRGCCPDQDVRGLRRGAQDVRGRGPGVDVL